MPAHPPPTISGAKLVVPCSGRRFACARGRDYNWGMEFTFDLEYNERLYEARHVGFETALEAVAAGRVRADYADANRNDSAERVLVITLGDSSYYLPYRVVGKKWHLQTLYPAAQFDRGFERETVQQPGYLNEEEKTIIDRVRNRRPSRLQEPDSTTLAAMRKAAAKLLRRERKGRIRISADGPPKTKEHFGEISGRMGKIGRW